jgi:hypothetical protein
MVARNKTTDPAAALFAPISLGVTPGRRLCGDDADPAHHNLLIRGSPSW